MGMFGYIMGMRFMMANCSYCSADNVESSRGGRTMPPDAYGPRDRCGEGLSKWRGGERLLRWRGGERLERRRGGERLL